MATTQPIKPGTISKKMLSFDISKSGTTRSSNQDNSLTTNDNEYTWICGEAIALGDAVSSPDSSGKVWKASVSDASNKCAFAISKGNYAINANGLFQISKKFRCESYNFAFHATVWLISGTPNLSTTIPTLVAGQNYQRCGKSISQTEFIIDIEEPMTLL